MTHHPAAFINAIAEEGTKEEAVQYLQKIWNENCELRAALAWYADEKNWPHPDQADDDQGCKALYDSGDRARAALDEQITPRPAEQESGIQDNSRPRR